MKPRSQLNMTEFTQTLRHYCRNPRCRSKLPSPASDPRKAFCTRGCHSSFYLKRCVVCENDKPAGSTARRKLCRRPKCEGRYRINSAHYSFLGADTTSAANVPRSAQSAGIKSADFDDRSWHIVAGPKITAAVYHCATLPVDPETARRSNAANDWERIRKESAWSKAKAPAPEEMQSDWRPCSPSVSVADDLRIPNFLNASRRPFHQRALWSQPNDSATPAHDFSVARPRPVRRVAERRPSGL
jgi:hypothetical protein